LDCLLTLLLQEGVHLSMEEPTHDPDW
jgi:hypothetical protein